MESTNTQASETNLQDSWNQERGNDFLQAFVARKLDNRALVTIDIEA